MSMRLLRFRRPLPRALLMSSAGSALAISSAVPYLSVSASELCVLAAAMAAAADGNAAGGGGALPCGSVPSALCYRQRRTAASAMCGYELVRSDDAAGAPGPDLESGAGANNKAAPWPPPSPAARGQPRFVSLDVFRGITVLYFPCIILGSAGTNFTPHIITASPSEDVTAKIIAFANQSSCAVCVLSAMGHLPSLAAPVRLHDLLRNTHQQDGASPPQLPSLHIGVQYSKVKRQLYQPVVV